MWLYSRTYVFVGNNSVYIGAKFNLSLKGVIQKLFKMQVFVTRSNRSEPSSLLFYICFLVITAIEAGFRVEIIEG